MRYLLLTSLLVFFHFSAQGQCDCTNCPVELNSGVTGGVASEIEISGATNPTIGTNGQGLRSVRLHLVHASLEEIDVILSKQGGGVLDFSRLIEQNGSSTSDTVTLEVCFINCEEDADPDTGFPEVFDSGAGYSNDSTYIGKYFPSQGNPGGCFDDRFNGLSVNGIWELEISGSPSFGGTLVNWELDFYDNSGTICQEFCVISNCQADGGDINGGIDTLFEGDPALDRSLPPTYPGAEPDPALYGYTYVITNEETDVIIAYDEEADLTTFGPGTYTICGLSYLIDDFDDIPDPNGSYTLTDLQDDIDEPLFCADLSENCETITILPELISSQCECSDCPFTIPEQGSAESTLTVTGGTNPSLGVNGQQLKAIHLDFFHNGIGEIELTLQAPDGSQVQLIDQNFLAQFNRDNTFSICFVDCGEPTEPFPGTSANFDTEEFDVIGQSYEGVYYPSVPTECLSNLTGDVNGEWTLIWDDWLVLMGGTLFNWRLEFEDNSGTECEVVCEVDDCLADGGDINGMIDTLCLGDPELNRSLPPSYSGSEPDPSEYGYTYVIADADSEEILAYDPDADLTGFGLGTYTICGLSYLLIDFDDIPDPNGSYSLGDLQDDIDEPAFCADLSENCETITILPEPVIPNVSGPLEVCPGEPVEYIIENFDPQFEYIVTINQGGFSAFSVDEETVSITFTSGPAELCFQAENACDISDEFCITIEVTNSPDPVEITGPTTVCEGQEYVYTIVPTLGPGQSYNITVDDGTIVDQSGNTVTIEWLTGGSNTITVAIVGSGCLPDPGSLTVTIETYDFPPTFNSPATGCVGDTFTSFIDPDPDILSYSWFGSNIDILSGGNSNMVTYVLTTSGTIDICLEVETDCGLFGPECESIEVNEVPEPEIIIPAPSCDFTFSLDALVEPGNDASWIDVDGPDIITFSPPNSPNTTATVFEAGIYTIAIEENNNGCLGYDTVQVEIFASPEIVDTSFNCDLNGDFTFTFFIDFGTAPYEINGDLIPGNTFTSDPISSGTPFTFTVTDANGCTDEISDSYDCPCLIDAGTMSGNLLEACIDDNEVVTAIYNNDGTQGPDDIGRYYLHDNPGDQLGTIFDDNTTGVFAFVPGMVPGQTYYISYVVGEDLGGVPDLTDPCLSVAIGQPVIFYENPTADYLGDDQFCELSTLFLVDVSAFVDNFSWSQVNGPGTISFDDPTAQNPFVTVSEAGSYTFRLDITNPACDDFLEFTIAFREPPLVNIISTDCTSQDSFILVLDIQGSGTDFTVDLPGTLSGTTFTSEPLDNSQSYTLQITDDAGCSSSANIGPILCDCLSEAGDMPTGQIDLCITADSIFLDFLGGGNLDSDDTTGFVIHSGTGNFLVDPVFFSSVDSFPLPDTLEAGQLYYISAVVGNALANGAVDLSDPCLAVSPGQRLFLYDLPDFTLDDSVSVCGFEARVAVLNAGVGFIDVVSNSTGANITFDVQNDTLIWQTDTASQIIYTYREDNGFCERTDTASVELLGQPAFTAVQTECLAEEFTYSFSVTGGQAPYLLNGNVIPSLPVQGDTLSADSVLTFNLEDQSGCFSDTLILDVDCSCLSQVGDPSPNLIELCTGDSLLSSAVSFSGTQVATGDTVIYILYDGPDLSSAGEYARSFTPDFADPGSPRGDSVYLRAWVGPIAGDSILFADPCAAVSAPIILVWQETNTFSVDVSENQLCIADSFEIVVSAEGLLPFTLDIAADNGSLTTRALDSSLDTLYLPSLSGTVNWSFSAETANCPSGDTVSLSLEGIEPLTVNFNAPDTLCNDALQGSQLDLHTLLADTSIQGLWTSTDFSIQNDQIDADGLPAGNYEVTFSTVGFEDPCPGQDFILSIPVDSCPCPRVTLPDSLALCTTDSILLLNDLLPASPFPGSWEINNVGGQPNPPTISNGNLIFYNADQGRYELAYIYANPTSPNCPEAAILIVNLEQPLAIGELLTAAPICRSESTEINLFDYLEGANRQGQWSDENGPVDSLISASDYGLGLESFSYRLAAQGACAAQSIELELEFSEAPNVQVTSMDERCAGEENGVIEATIMDNGTGPYESFINGIMVDLPAENLAPNSYSFTLENTVGCSTDTLITIAPGSSIQVDLGPDLTGSVGDRFTFNAGVSPDTLMLSEVQWFVNGVAVPVSSLQWSDEFREASTVSIEVVTELGCPGRDQLQIRLNSPAIYIPNVFHPSGGINENSRFGPISPANDIQVERFFIFDRWGNQLFGVEDVPINSEPSYWNGRANGQLLNPGVYVYNLRVRYANGETEVFVGSVTLVD